MTIAPARAFTISEPESTRLKWEDARQEDRDSACKLRDVFMPSLEKAADDTRPLVELEAELVYSYTRVFGHPRSGEWLRTLYFRFIKEDAGRGDWLNLSLYLLGNARKEASNPRPAKSSFDHEDLGTSLKGILIHRGTPKNRHPGKLTKRQKQSIWVAAHAHLNCLAAPGSPVREAASRSVRQYLFAAVPMLAPSLDALKRNFNRKSAALDASNGKPSAVEDRRETDSGFYRGPEITEEAHKALVAHAVFHCGGRVAQAWRNYLSGKIQGVSPERILLDYYVANSTASKSYVPSRVREAVKYQVAALESIHHGPYQYGQTAHLILDDSKIYAGDVWSSDDATLPVYCLAGDVLMRGQFLLTVDRRSRRILGYCLIPERSYDSLAIRSHIVVTADTHGLPRIAEWERGLWQKSKLAKGNANADTVPPEEAELGLREFGITFVHRRSPKAKIVERVIGALQDMMEGEPGYCGRNEQTERFERFYKLKAACEAGRADPREHFYTFEQWEERLGEICDEYNRTAHGRGTLLDGMSPNQAYEAFQNPNDPPVKFDTSSRYLLSTHRRAIKVTANGIDFAVGKRHFIYRGGRSGEFIGQKILLWFNPESPDIAYITDLKRKNPFAVELVLPVPSVGASREQLAEEMRKLRSHQKPIRTIYRALKADFKQTFRKNLVSPATHATGEAFELSELKIKERRNDISKVRRAARESGIVLTGPVRDTGVVAAGIKLENEARAAIEAERQAAQKNATP